VQSARELEEVISAQSEWILIICEEADAQQ
jgi:hypothetical protein